MIFLLVFLSLTLTAVERIARQLPVLVMF